MIENFVLLFILFSNQYYKNMYINKSFISALISFRILYKVIGIWGLSSFYGCTFFMSLLSLHIFYNIIYCFVRPFLKIFIYIFLNDLLSCIFSSNKSDIYSNNNLQPLHCIQFSNIAAIVQ